VNKFEGAFTLPSPKTFFKKAQLPFSRKNERIKKTQKKPANLLTPSLAPSQRSTLFAHLSSAAGAPPARQRSGRISNDGDAKEKNLQRGGTVRAGAVAPRRCCSCCSRMVTGPRGSQSPGGPGHDTEMLGCVEKPDTVWWVFLQLQQILNEM